MGETHEAGKLHLGRELPVFLWQDGKQDPVGFLQGMS